jgi:hypothetical protein
LANLEDENKKVVSIFNRKNEQSQNSNFSYDLTSRDSDFQSLVNDYLTKNSGSTPNDLLSKNEIGMKIMKYQTINSVDILIKFSILQIALGYGSTSVSHQLTNENFMCFYFKRSLIEYAEQLLKSSQYE